MIGTMIPEGCESRLETGRSSMQERWVFDTNLSSGLAAVGSSRN